LAQSSDELKSKYGAPIKVFEIRPGIMMTVQFDESGEASEMRIQRHAITDSTVYLDTAIPPYLSKEIVDELVPVAERGAKGKFSDLMLIVGVWERRPMIMRMWLSAITRAKQETAVDW
jgi:hypothetical protein